MIGRRAAGLAILALSVPLAPPDGVAWAQAQREAPPPVPSSYELRRIETQARQAAEEAARVAKRKSRQIEYTGAGTTAGDTGTGLSLDITAKQLGGLAITGVIGIAAVRALSVGTEPNPLTDASAGAGTSAGVGATATTTTTGTN
jgi:hypothetical protein